jgi:hypothetical protein
MRVKHHLVISLALSGIVYLVFRSWGMSIAVLASGVLIDLDHVLDYLLTHGMRFQRRDFFRYFYEKQYQKLFLPFHGWEWVAVWGVLAWKTGWDSWSTGVFIGIGHHLLLDQVSNRPGPGGYSLLWRLKNGFHRKSFFPKERKPNP